MYALSHILWACNDNDPPSATVVTSTDLPVKPETKGADLHRHTVYSEHDLRAVVRKHLDLWKSPAGVVLFMYEDGASSPYTTQPVPQHSDHCPFVLAHA